MTRLELLNEIIDLHVEALSAKTDPVLTDTKTLTEILKAIMVFEQIKKLEGPRTEFDLMSDEELDEKVNKLG